MKYQKVLFVCSGNQCRSPIAEAIFRDMLSKDVALRSVGIEIKSAGTLPNINGAAATNEATIAMQEQGIDLSPHKAKHVDIKLINWADIVLVMCQEHKSYITERFGNKVNKVYLLTEFVGTTGYVGDPIGSGLEAYRQCAIHLQSLLTLLKRQIL
jgi:protein-tyrosine-phosphatase